MHPSVRRRRLQRHALLADDCRNGVTAKCLECEEYGLFAAGSHGCKGDTGNGNILLGSNGRRDARHQHNDSHRTPTKHCVGNEVQERRNAKWFHGGKKSKCASNSLIF